jgi:exosortase A
MTALLPIRKVEAADAAAEGWRPHLIALALLAAAILLIFLRDAADLVHVWLSRSTFNHCALILPIIGWLAWQRLPELRRLAPCAWAPGLLLVGVGALVWLLGEAGFVAIARQAALVLMLQGAVIACLGPAVSRGLAFPIFYALFMIPIGDELMGPMQTLTARMSMVLLGLVGVPAHIEGVFITIPNGYFEVAEACSGVEFLIAMVAYGALVSNLCFRSWPRRILFMAAAVVIPIVANGIRAFGTIYIAHLTDIEFAAGFDHVIYGWFFFAFIIALLMAVGWRFFDRGIADPWFDPAELQPEGTRSGSQRHLARIAGLAFAVAVLPVLWSSAVASTRQPDLPAAFALPDVPGWHRIARDDGRPWQPHFAGADILRLGRYRDARGREVDLAIAVFARQEEGREIVGFGQGAVGPDSAWAWTARGAPPPGGRSDRIASHGTVREVLSFYRVGGIVTGSDYRVKLETMKTRLLGGPRRAVAVLVSAEAPAEGADPRPALDAFLADLGPVAPLADRAAGL